MSEVIKDIARQERLNQVYRHLFAHFGISSQTEFPEQRERSVTVPESYIGTTNKLTATFHGFSGDDEWNSDIPIKAYNNNSEIIGQATIRNATFIRNVSTEYSGCLFAGNPDFGIEINDDWEFPHTVTW